MSTTTTHQQHPTSLHKGYAWMMAKANHPHAVWYLCIVSFIESSFFPFPPDPLFVAMVLQHPHRAWWYAFLCTASSVIGGYLGYLIGFALYTTIGQTIISFYGLEESFATAVKSLNEWAFVAISLKGFTPIPYKLVTIASGVARIDLWTFTLASIIARSIRFAYVAAALYYFGEPIKKLLDRHLVPITIIMIVSLFIGFVVFGWLF